MAFIRVDSAQMPSSLPLLTISTLFLAHISSAWMPDSNAKLSIKYGEDPSEQFLGNASAPDHFKLLDKDDLTILIGGRNTIYNLSLYDLKENTDQRLEWQATYAYQEMCQLKGKSVDDCQNYPRVAARYEGGSGERLVCGTNAYKPLCRRYSPPTAPGAKPQFNEFDGTGVCPCDPDHNSTAIFVNGQMYTATVADFSGIDPLIYRKPQRTERSDLRQLNDPSFVGAISNNDFVFFFYRETAVEYMNCGKSVYSRVARVCLNDKGGPHQFGDRWTTFLKARLNCSMPGEYPFYFDEIQSVTELISGMYGDGGVRSDIVYTVLTTPVNAIGGSAICAFSMRDILATFEGNFKSQETINANWLPVEEDKVPNPRPGSCVEDSRLLPDAVVNFVKTHSLMDQVVPSFLAKPLIVRVSLQYRFSSITVHPQVQAMSGNRFDVLYIGTDDGRVIKAINAASTEGDFDKTIDEQHRAPVRTVVISESQVLPSGTPVKQLHVAISTERLIIISGEIIKTVPLHHCNNLSSCRDCVSLQDPHCAWDTKMHQCAWVGNRQFPNPERFLQNVEKGNTDICNRVPSPSNRDWQLKSPIHGTVGSTSKDPPTIEQDETLKIEGNNDLGNEIVIELVGTNVISDSNSITKHEPDSLTVNRADNVIYTAHSLYIAVVASCLVTLLVGFVIGYLFSRRFRHPFFADTSPFNEQHNHLNRLSPLETPLNANPSVYLPPRNKTVNLVANVAPVTKQDNLHHELGKERSLDIKNSNESLDKDLKCGTLQKVKKTYI